MDVILNLRNDNRNLRRLLSMVARQAGRMERGEAPDTDLLAAVAEYCLEFPEVYHNQHVRLLHRRIGKRRPSAAGSADALARRLQQQVERSVALAICVDGIARAPAAAGREAAGELRRFVAFQCRHLEWEERVLFPAAESCLDEADRAALAEQIAECWDDWRGSKVEANFLANTALGR